MAHNKISIPTDHEYVGIIDGQQHKPILSVSWDTSGVCNYRCSYCDPHYHDGKDRFPPLENAISFFLELDQHSEKSIFLELKGGEPTHWKQLPEFLNLASEKNWGVCLVTNGSKNLSWWEENLHKLADINLSLHPEFYKMNHITEIISYILPRRNLYVKFLMYPPFFNQCVSAIDELRTTFPSLNLAAIPVSQVGTDNELCSYSEEQIQKIRELNSYKRTSHKRIWPPFPFEDRYRAFKLLENGEVKEFDKHNIKLDKDNSWVGWLCHAGLDRLHIGTNGDIFRGQCKQGGRIGNIKEGWWSLPKDPVTCSKKNCFCGSELLLKKWNPTKLSLLSTAHIKL